MQPYMIELLVGPRQWALVAIGLTLARGSRDA
jgi:hypothetical protein